MKQIISADIIFTNIGEPIQNGYIITDETGFIIETGSDSDITPDVFFEGAIVPGFFNAHCHLENSGIILETVDGLADFIVKHRTYSLQNQQDIQAIHDIDSQMAGEGVVFCGDISNTTITIPSKLSSKIHYHTFLEIYGSNPKHAEEFFFAGLEKKETFLKNGLPCSLTPHSFYSLSPELQKISFNYISDNERFTSVHFMESLKENHPFAFGIEVSNKLNINKIKNPNSSLDMQSLLQSVYSNFREDIHVLFVHAIYSDLTFLNYIIKTLNNSWFCVCPTSNLFIENKVMSDDCLKLVLKKLLIGTDGQSSNHNMSFLEELKLLQENSSLKFSDILKSATLNGADFFSVNNMYGSIEVGKRPGLVHIYPFNLSSMKLQSSSKSKRII